MSIFSTIACLLCCTVTSFGCSPKRPRRAGAASGKESLVSQTTVALHLKKKLSCFHWATRNTVGHTCIISPVLCADSDGVVVRRLAKSWTCNSLAQRGTRSLQQGPSFAGRLLGRIQVHRGWYSTGIIDALVACGVVMQPPR